MNTSHDTSASAERRSADIRVATAEDLPEILRVQHAGFARVARDLDLPPEALPPMRETLADLRRLMADGLRFLVAEDGNRMVGTVRAEYRSDGVVEIGRLAVDDGCERRGIASALMAALEGSYPDVARFELFTGQDALGALALYAALGYTHFRSTRHGPVTIVWLAKDRQVC